MLLSSFLVTFDVIRNSESSQSRITLVDFAPLLKETFKKLAFEWQELACDVVEFETPEFRYLEQSIQQQQLMANNEDEEEEPVHENQVRQKIVKV